MKINLNIVVDLGELDSREAQIADAGELRWALAEAIQWHGLVELFDVYEHDTGAIISSHIPSPAGALVGVEWGGR